MGGDDLDDDFMLSAVRDSDDDAEEVARPTKESTKGKKQHQSNPLDDALRSLNHHTKVAEEDFVFERSHFSSQSGSNLLEQIKSSCSIKKLKKWKQTLSPGVILVALSARRAVEILKELAPLKIRAVKLFPKSGDVSAQAQQLRSTPFGLAVGTPHRLLALADEGALQPSESLLVLVDANVSGKNFTVCTLPDTAPQCAEFLRKYVAKKVEMVMA